MSQERHHMKGCRPLTDLEVKKVSIALGSARDKALFILGIRSGFRISELLSLKVSDVYQFGEILPRVQVERKHMKKKIESRSVPIHEEAKSALLLLILELRLISTDHLFKSKKGENMPMTRIQAWRILRDAYNLATIGGNVATHSMRKTFAQKVYQAVEGDLVKTQRALGHKSLNSTASYLSFADEEVDEAILGVA